MGYVRGSSTFKKFSEESAVDHGFHLVEQTWGLIVIMFI